MADITIKKSFIAHQAELGKKIMPAFGLIEVIVAIAISGIIILGAVDVSLRATRLVKENEIADAASGILLRSLEFSRSAADVKLTEKQGTAATRYYRLATTGTGNQAVVDLTPATNQTPIVNCQVADPNNCTPNGTPSSEYAVPLVTGGFQVFNQIEVSRVTLAGQPAGVNSFQIRSLVVYQYLNETTAQQLTSFRSE